jgi:hypothetical protein
MHDAFVYTLGDSVSRETTATMDLDHLAPPDANRCPYCRSSLRRVPGLWLSRSGFECARCGDFIDFSRPLTEADGAGTADSRQSQVAGLQS